MSAMQEGILPPAMAKIAVHAVAKRHGARITMLRFLCVQDGPSTCVCLLNPSS